ncbi:type II toxin-antitoxin system RelE/ParE family toxin [Selenomonas artemidis]|uniref:type II toxin-antitoxin system RelE family toxin n=1 Tax=Selenomonas artemidis TaxID=671224 RepID=UPI0028D831F4|nr:type II toxin-antitoxin system RelE/ParE family toxin [Selenomonas artemidis]
MMYSVIFEKQVYRQLKKLDPFTAFMIRNWISKNLEGSNAPRSHGKALQVSLSGYWRYRIGNYRLIARIVDEELIIIAVSVAHRSKVYR